MRGAWLRWVLGWVGLLGVAALVAVLPVFSAGDRWLYFAAATLALTSIAHSVLGERFLLQPLLRRRDLPRIFGDDDFTRQVLRFAWHLLSIALFGFAAVLLALTGSGPTTTSISRIVSLTAASCALVAGVTSRGRHLSWVAFAAVAVAAWIGP
ncbi:MAG: hypothetical protein ABR575_08150 [Actinomycetota bacterium]